jgi:manganese/iron transport system permease protein
MGDLGMMFALFAPVLAAGALGGASTAAVGVYVVGMRVPFLGVCISHAALAGAVLGGLAGLSGDWLTLPALGAAMAAALVLGLLDPRRLRADANVAMGFLFVLMLGLTFLGIGLLERQGSGRESAMGLLWGGLTFCTWRDVGWMAVVAAAQAGFLWGFGKEMRAILFSREHAAASGVPVGPVWTGFLVLTSAALAVNFQTVGGLMIYGLMVCPAAGAFQLVRGHGRTLAVAVGIGALSGVGGFLLALWTHLPSAGAAIVLLAAALAAGAWLVGRARRRRKHCVDNAAAQ